MQLARGEALLCLSCLIRLLVALIPDETKHILQTRIFQPTLKRVAHAEEDVDAGFLVFSYLVLAPPLDVATMSRICDTSALKRCRALPRHDQTCTDYDIAMICIRAHFHESNAARNISAEPESSKPFLLRAWTACFICHFILLALSLPPRGPRTFLSGAASSTSPGTSSFLGGSSTGTAAVAVGIFLGAALGGVVTFLGCQLDELAPDMAEGGSSCTMLRALRANATK